MVSWGVNFLHLVKYYKGQCPATASWFLLDCSLMVSSLCGLGPCNNFKISPSPNLYALLSPINMTTMIRQHKSSPLLQDLPGKADHKAIHCPTANFGPLSRGSVTNSMLITVFDTYLTPMSPGASVWGNTLQILNSSTLTYISMSRAHKYLNLKEHHNQDIKEQITKDFTRNLQPQRHSMQEVFSNSKIQFPIFWC